MTEHDISKHNATLTLRKLPGNIRSFIVPNAEGYTIVVNSELGPQEQREALLHELQHIIRGDLFNSDYVEYAH